MVPYIDTWAGNLTRHENGTSKPLYITTEKSLRVYFLKIVIKNRFA